MVTGLVTAFFYLIALLYSIHDFDAVLSTTYTFPLAEVYHQATGTRGGALGLLIIIFLPPVCTCIGATTTAGRTLWTLARDDATPFSPFLARINTTHKNPLNATFAVALFNTVLGAIYVGSLTAFNAFVGSFVVLTTLSYLMAILPHLLSRRRNVIPGPFWMPDRVAYVVMALSCAYMAVWDVIYFFPFALPVDAETMNYAVVIVGGLTALVSVWWLWKSRRGYVGPKALVEELVGEARDVDGRVRIGAEKI